MRLFLIAAAAAVVCGSDKPQFEAEVGGKSVIADADLKFSLNYNMTDGPNKTESAMNDKLTVKDATATAELVNNSLIFTLNWGMAAKQSKLAFVMEVVENKTELKNIVLSTFTTPENGFVNASEEASVTYSFPVSSFSWPNAGGFRCNSATKLMDGAKSSMALSSFRVQAFHGKTFGTQMDECTADQKHNTTVAPMTTPMPTTTTPPPAPINEYFVKEGKDVCVHLKTAINFAITYKAVNKTDNTTTYHTVNLNSEVPDTGVTTTGSCSLMNGTEQELTLSFNKTWSLTFKISNEKKFTKASNDAASFTVYQIEVMGSLPPNATRENFNLTNHIGKNENGALDRFLLGSVGKSVTCGKYKHDFGAIDSDNVTLTLSLSDVQFEAFSKSGNVTFAPSQECVAPAGSNDLIPIIVGACLAALVVIVLVAYLIGRARARRGGYQSV